MLTSPSSIHRRRGSFIQHNRGISDAFVTKLNPNGSALVYSTYLGGSGIEGGTAIAIDSGGAVYVTGFTSSNDFPTTFPLQQTFGGGGFDGFVAKVNSSGSALEASTYLGGSDIDSAFGIALDSARNAYVMGVTASTNFPTANPLQQAFGGGTADLFIARIKQGPSISGAAITGKKLLVLGSGFDQGARILLNGQQQKTINDGQNPTTSLLGKTAGKKISPGEKVTLQVRNSDGALSNEFSFMRP